MNPDVNKTGQTLNNTWCRLLTCLIIRRTWKEPDIRQNTEFDIPSETGNQKGWKSGPSLNIFMVGYLNAWTNEEVAGRAQPHKEHKKSRISGRMLKLISRRIPTENLKRSFTCSPEQTRKSPAVPGSTKNIMYRLHISSPDLAPICVSVFRPRLSYVHLNTGNLKPISTL